MTKQRKILLAILLACFGVLVVSSYRMETKKDTVKQEETKERQEGNIIIDSGMQGLLGEYDSSGNLLNQYQIKLSKYFVYRVYKYDFKGFYFN